MLPEGLRLFATYVMAHHTYLNGEIWSAYGMGKAALFMAERPYPISMTYIHCMMAVCAINRKHKQEGGAGGDAPELGAGEDGWVSGAFY